MFISQYQKKTDTVQKKTIMVSESLYEDLKKIPETFFRGRWLYYWHEETKTIVLIKKVNIVLPKGFKTFKYTRIEGEPKPLCMTKKC